MELMILLSYTTSVEAVDSIENDVFCTVLAAELSSWKVVAGADDETLAGRAVVCSLVLSITEVDCCEVDAAVVSSIVDCWPLEVDCGVEEAVAVSVDICCVVLSRENAGCELELAVCSDNVVC